MILRYVACKILKPSSWPSPHPNLLSLNVSFLPLYETLQCVRACVWHQKSILWLTVLIVCVHRLELLGGNIWWTRSDCSHTTQVWEDCAVTGMVKVACEWASFCYVAVQECCSDTHCLGHLCSIFPIGCTHLKHIIHTKPHLQVLPGDEATTIHSSHSSSYKWVFGVWWRQI